MKYRERPKNHRQQYIGEIDWNGLDIYIAFSIGNQLFFSVVPIFFFLYWKAIFCSTGNRRNRYRHISQYREPPRYRQKMKYRKPPKKYRQVEILHRLCPQEKPVPRKTLLFLKMKNTRIVRDRCPNVLPREYLAVLGGTTTRQGWLFGDGFAVWRHQIHFLLSHKKANKTNKQRIFLFVNFRKPYDYLNDNLTIVSSIK